MTTRAPTGQLVKMFKQVRVPPAHVTERAYPKLVDQECDAEKYDELKFRPDEIIFAAYDKAEMMRGTILVIARSDFVPTSKSLFLPDVIILAITDLD